jgi:hypothetical protein
MGGEKEVPEVVMSYSQSPSLVEDEWFTEPPSSDVPLRNPDKRSDRRIVAGPQAASTHAPHSFGRRGPQQTVETPSVARRFLRFLFRFLIAVSIGVGATLGAQTDIAKEMLAANAPTLAWVLSVSPTKSLAVAAPAQQTELITSAMASNLDAIRRNVEQLGARQDQIAQNVAALQAAQEDIRQKMSAPPPSPPREAAVVPPRPAQPRAPSPTAASAAAPRPAPLPLSPAPSR